MIDNTNSNPRPTPHDLDAERWVLGACLLRPESLDTLADDLHDDHFFRTAHQALYRQLLAMRAKGEPIDIGTVAAQLLSYSVPDITPADVSRLVDGMPNSTNAAAYARIVKGHSLRRNIIAMGRRLVGDAHDPSRDVEALLEWAEDAVFNMSSSTAPKEWVSSAELMTEFMAMVERAEKRHGRPAGVLTGFRDLDAVVGGFQAGDLVLLGGRPSLGKTALALQIVLAASIDCRVAVFSLEMSQEQVTQRVVAGEARVDSWRLRQALLLESDLMRLGEAVNALASRKFHLLDVPGLSPLQLRSRLRQLQAAIKEPIGLVVIDYLQLMAALPEHRRENRTNQVAGISRALKVIAREFGVPLLVLSQLNRNVEVGGGRPPSLADLRDSGALEQDADVVMLLHRQSADASPTGGVQLNVAKHRNGSTGVLDLAWYPEFTRFEDAGPELAGGRR